MVQAFSPWPSFTEEERDAVDRVLASNRVNYWTGEEAREFEREFAAWCSTKHAVALANGTLALELALKAAGIGPGDDVIVTPRSFFASASCAVTVGARPVFADVDAESQNLSAATIEAALTPATRAVVCVHLAGLPCDMEPIMALAEEHDLVVIEDCAQAHGASYRGRPVGSIGHIAAWSFCQDKIMTTGGEGGMITTSSDELWSRVWSLKDHGKNWDTVYNTEHPPGFRWLHESFGTNARMLEVQAAIGRIQLKRMPEWRAGRAENASHLAKAAAPHRSVRLPQTPTDCEHAWYRFYLFAEPAAMASGWTRDKMVAEINERGVPCFHGACPAIYDERAFRDAGLRPDKPLPVATRLGETSMMLLVHPTLTADEIDRCRDVLDEVLGAASR